MSRPHDSGHEHALALRGHPAGAAPPEPAGGRAEGDCAGGAGREIEAIEANDPADATKWAFTSKLQTESNRWADKIGDGTGATMLDLIKTLNAVGGGSVTVSVTGSEPGGEPVIEVEATRES
jgi:hypothetical protein